MLDGHLRDLFERVTVISLARRPKRLGGFWTAIHEDWPFEWPEVCWAIDGSRLPIPDGWTGGPEVLGQIESHRHVLQRALSDGIRSMLVMDDDARPTRDFAQVIGRLMDDVAATRPAWRILALGGEARPAAENPEQPAAGAAVWRRTFRPRLAGAYAVRGEGVAELYRLCTRALSAGRDWTPPPDAVRSVAYETRPPLFLRGEAGGELDSKPPAWRRWLSDRDDSASPGGDDSTEWRKRVVVLLDAPRHIVAKLRYDGWHTGFLRDDRTGMDQGLIEIFDQAEGAKRVEGLKRWLSEVGEEADAMTRGVLTIWHPQATPELIRLAGDRQVVPIVARTVAEAIAKLEAAKP